MARLAIMSPRVAVVVDRDELLGHVDREVRDAVDREVADQLEGVGTLDVEVGHVVRLIEQHGRATPGELLVAPVAELLDDARHDRRRGLRLPQQLDRISGSGDGFLEIVRHG